MSDSRNDSDLSELIRLAATEEMQPDLVQNEAGQANDRLVHHLPVLLIAWMFCFAAGAFFVLEPLPKQHDLGIRAVQTRVSIAMYHTAHRVESYRKQTGALPAYLESEWQEAEEVRYETTPDGYVITGKSGEFELVYREGDDPEILLHYLFSWLEKL